MKRQARGFSLIEALLVLVLLTALGVATAAVLATVRRPEASVAVGAGQLHRRGVALALLREDLAANAAAGGSLRVALGAADTVAVVGAPPEEPLLSEYSVAIGGRGITSLYRRSGAASRQPAVQGVVGLQVRRLVTRGGDVAVRAGRHGDVLALDLELTFAWGERLGLHLPLGRAVAVDVR